MSRVASTSPSLRRLAHVLEASSGAHVGRHLPRRSLIFDALIAVLFAVVGWLLLRVFSPRADFDHALFAILISLPLVLRRRLPRVALLVIFAIGIVQMLVAIEIGLYDGALLFALYSAVGYTNRRFGLTSLAIAGVTIVIGALTSWWVFVERQFDGPTSLKRAASSLGVAVLVGATWALGERLRSARLGVISLGERAEQLEREREQLAQLATAAERARIAREMHDVIAHGLSVMIVQADGAAYVVDQSPETARQALEQISATGRESLAQMRNLLGLLRTGSAVPTEPVPPGPQPDLADLDQLLAEARHAGAAVETQIEGPVDGLPPMISLTAYRIIQEALTNARKHGGHEVSVRIESDVRGLRLTVTDDGLGPGGGASPASTSLQGSTGYGLMGMYERVSAVNGLLSAVPQSGGGFAVRAWLPLTTSPGPSSPHGVTRTEPT